MTDALHESGSGVGHEPRKHRVSFVAAAAADANLDELVVSKRLVDCREHGRAQARRADHDDRIQGVAEPAQVFALSFG